MCEPFPISDVLFCAAKSNDVQRGLIGWLSFTVGGLLTLDSVTLRRTREGRHCLSFPTRHDTSGKQHPLIRPVDSAARAAIEAAVLQALGLQERP